MIDLLEAGDGSPQATTLGQIRHFQTGSFCPSISPSEQQRGAARGRQNTNGDISSNCNGRWQATSLTTQLTPITNEFCRHNQARRNFASTRRLPHKKLQRSILIVDLILREYMKDAPAGQSAFVNVFDGRGEEDNGTNRMDGHSFFRATLHQPTSNGGNKSTKALTAQQQGEPNFNGAGIQTPLERDLRRINIGDFVPDNKGCQHLLKGWHQ